MKKLIPALPAVLVLSALALPASAQYAPTPHSAPRTPVNREAVAERRTSPPRDVEGQALILDGDHLRIGEYNLRLFGIVPPQLSASFGPQARAALDQLIGGGQSINCHVRDRDHDGHLLATCNAANGIDPALDLLRRGLAVAARGSIAETELAGPYVMAEQAAQNEKIGLWSVTLAAPTVNAVSAEPAKPEPVKIEAPKSETPKAEPAKTETAAMRSGEISAAKDVQPKSASAVMTPAKPAVALAAAQPLVDNSGLFARYQILIAGFLMLATTLSILVAVALHRRHDKREEMRALAAALRGELLAARAVCHTRMKVIQSPEDDRTTNWPRIRSTLYQAYVGRLGWLGAELSRQIASIYGQASDYAAYYSNADSSAAATTPKRQALQILASHIDEILPRLAAIEQSGKQSSLRTPTHYDASPPRQPVMESKPLTAIAAPQLIEQTVEPPLPPAQPVLESKLRNVVRHLRDHFVAPAAAPASDDPIADYTSLIEEDMERYSITDEDEAALSSFSKLGHS